MNFSEVDQKYEALKQQYQAGALTAAQFDDQLRALMIQDSQGRWWAKARETGDWNYYDNATSSWVAADPYAAARGRPHRHRQRPSLPAPAAGQGGSAWQGADQRGRPRRSQHQAAGVPAPRRSPTAPMVGMGRRSRSSAPASRSSSTFCRSWCPSSVSCCSSSIATSRPIADRSAARLFLILGIVSFLLSCVCSIVYASLIPMMKVDSGRQWYWATAFRVEGRLDSMTIDLRAAWNRVSADYQAAHSIPTAQRTLWPVGAAGRRAAPGGGRARPAHPGSGLRRRPVQRRLRQTGRARRRHRPERRAVGVRPAAGGPGGRGGGVRPGECGGTRPVCRWGAWDVVFSAYAFQYVQEMPRCLGAVQPGPPAWRTSGLQPGPPLPRLLLRRRGGHAVHRPQPELFRQQPAALELEPWKRRAWPWSPMHFTIAQWVEMLAAAGFRLTRLLEPAPPADLLDEIWPSDDALSSLRLIPQTIIFVAEKGRIDRSRRDGVDPVCRQGTLRWRLVE